MCPGHATGIVSHFTDYPVATTKQFIHCPPMSFCLGQKTMLFRPRKISSKKLLTMDILQRGQSMVFVKKSTFSLSVLLSKESQKETFFDLLDRKEFFLDLKAEVLTQSKKSTFCKGVSPWFLLKNRLFSHMFFFQQKKPERNII